MSSPRWKCAEPDPSVEAELRSEGVPALAATILSAFLSDPAHHAIWKGESPPRFPGEGDLPGLSEATNRVVAALERGESILIHGDYDVDGLMGAAVLAGGIKALGGKVETYIPSRFEGGYGLSATSLEAARESGATLLVTADCGTNSREVGEVLRSAGVDLVVTDHHTPERGAQPAGPVVNPHLDGSSLELKSLCGASVAYLLVRSLAGRLGKELSEVPFLRLLAIATVADVVPMSRLNRAICKEGFRALAQTPNPGLALLLGQINLSSGVASHHVGFHLAPRFNAAGRVEEASLVLDLLLERDPASAAGMVGRLKQLNDKRKGLQLFAYEGALREPAPSENVPVFFAASPEWHKGVIGPVAARLAEQRRRSAFVVAIEGEEGTGSARAHGADDVTARLAVCRDLLERYGGHTGAAGFSVRRDRLEALKERLETGAPAPAARPRPFLPLDSGRVDEAWKALLFLDPLGPGVPEPLFALEGLEIRSTRVLKGRHLKWEASGSGGKSLTLLSWDFAQRGLHEKSLGPGRIPLVRIVPEMRRGNGPYYLLVEGVF